MLGILTEDDSDVAVLRRIIDKFVPPRSCRISGQGFGGYPNLLRRLPVEIELLRDLGCQRCLICVDADDPSGQSKRNELTQAVRDAGEPDVFTVVVAIQEIEAWFLADSASIRSVVSFYREPDQMRPEHIPNPKEWIQSRSKDAGGKSKYYPAIHNPRIADAVDLVKVAERCPSFAPVLRFCGR